MAVTHPGPKILRVVHYRSEFFCIYAAIEGPSTAEDSARLSRVAIEPAQDLSAETRILQTFASIAKLSTLNTLHLVRRAGCRRL